MRVGLGGIGIGPLAQPAVLEAVATGAEARGFDGLWAGEHVVMVDSPRSRYPYSSDGRIAVPVDTDWGDPFVSLAAVAAVTDTIGLATGVLLLPEHNPLVVAKQAATLDLLSRGRLTLGVGIGWSAEEFDALGVPFARRGERTVEYIEVLRRLWTEPRASFRGSFADFDGVGSFPKPVRRGGVPVVLGGNGPRALARAARHGDGWYGFALGADEVATCLASLDRELEACGRRREDLEIVVSPFGSSSGPEAIPELAALGVSELVVVEQVPTAPQDVPPWLDDLAERWVEPARLLSAG